MQLDDTTAEPVWNLKLQKSLEGFQIFRVNTDCPNASCMEDVFRSYWCRKRILARWKKSWKSKRDVQCGIRDEIIWACARAEWYVLTSTRKCGINLILIDGMQDEKQQINRNTSAWGFETPSSYHAHLLVSVTTVSLTTTRFNSSVFIYMTFEFKVVRYCGLHYSPGAYVQNLGPVGISWRKQATKLDVFRGP